jgi:putative FmdB family regulatory protein
MPLYEYYCPHCDLTFDKLRPFSQADAPIQCPDCGGEDVQRRLSRFACFTTGSDGSVRAVSGGGGCAGCSASSCAGCSSR